LSFWIVTTISLSTAVTPGAVSAACRAVCNAANDGTWPWRCTAVVHRFLDRAGMEIGHPRDRLLHAALDIGGGRLGLRLVLDQVVDDTHCGELADCALGGVSLRCRLDLSMQNDAPVTDLRRDRVGDLCSPEAAGYFLSIREPDLYEHRMLKGPDTDVNLHVFSQGCPEIERMLLFRDRLRSSEADRELYERKKRELARRTWKYKLRGREGDRGRGDHHPSSRGERRLEDSQGLATIGISRRL
jgi:hypothetical protein